MPKKRFSAEQIVVLLRQIEVLMSQGKAAPMSLPDPSRHFAATIRSLLVHSGLRQAVRPADLWVHGLALLWQICGIDRRNRIPESGFQ
jgi:hypothetical protein